MHLHHRCVQWGGLDEPDDRLDDESYSLMQDSLSSVEAVWHQIHVLLRYVRGSFSSTRQKEIVVRTEEQCDAVLIMTGAWGICNAPDISHICSLDGRTFLAGQTVLLQGHAQLEVQITEGPSCFSGQATEVDGGEREDSDVVALDDAGQRDDPGDNWQEQRRNIIDHAVTRGEINDRLDVLLVGFPQFHEIVFFFGMGIENEDGFAIQPWTGRPLTQMVEQRWPFLKTFETSHRFV